MVRPRNPEDVFTPKAIVAREMFARRNEPDALGIPGLQDSLRDALREKGGQVLVYGDTGVGKSSLIKYAAEDEHMSVLNVECLSNKTYEDIVEDGIRKLVDTREIERTRTVSGGVGADAGIKVPSLLSFKGNVKSDYGRSRRIEVVAKPPLDALLDAMMQSDCRLLVLDNFQNVIDVPTRKLVAQMMEFLSDRASDTGDIKCVVIGIADDAHNLLSGSGSFSRRTTEIGVPRMPDEEISEILRLGFNLLALDLPESFERQLVFFSDGFPYFTHLLGLSTSRMARLNNHAMITEADVLTGIQRAVSQVDRSYADRLIRAYEASGEVQPRRRILRLLAQSNERQWRHADVVAAYARKYESRFDYAFLNVALGQLVKPQYSSILKRSGIRPFVYQFADPHMRPYLRLNPPEGT